MSLPPEPSSKTSRRRTSLLEPYTIWLFGGAGAALARILPTAPQSPLELSLPIASAAAASLVLLLAVAAQPSLSPDRSPPWIYEGALPMAWLWIMQALTAGMASLDWGIWTGAPRADQIWREPQVFLGALFLQMLLSALWTLRRARRG